MKKVITAFALTALFGCAGNAIGLEGSYEGSFDQQLRRRTTSFSFGSSSTSETEQRLVDDGSLTVERGTDGVDAVLSGLACPLIPLMVDDSELRLAEETTCEVNEESDTTFGSSTSRSETTTKITIADVVITRGSDNGTVEVDATVRTDAEMFADGDRVQEIEDDLTLTFDGARLAME